jgi:hypothetical protein
VKQHLLPDVFVDLDLRRKVGVLRLHTHRAHVFMLTCE